LFAEAAVALLKEDIFFSESVLFPPNTPLKIFKNFRGGFSQKKGWCLKAQLFEIGFIIGPLEFSTPLNFKKGGVFPQKIFGSPFLGCLKVSPPLIWPHFLKVFWRGF